MAAAAPKAEPGPEAGEACASVVGALTGALDEVGTLLADLGTGLPTDPTQLGGVLDPVTAAVDAVIGSGQALTVLGCLPDPTTALQRALPEQPGEAVPGEPDLPVVPLPPGTPAVPEVPACAAPVADLLSQLFGLLSSWLEALTASLTDLPGLLTGLLDQVTGLQGTVTDLTSGTEPCLPVAVPLQR
jgi:ABC-type transporter Mla subunit MlaD